MDKRIKLHADDLAKNLRIWLILVGQRRANLLRDLWTRRGEEHDKPKIEHARHELARFLAEKMIGSGWEVTRKEVAQDDIIQSEEWIGPR